MRYLMMWALVVLAVFPASAAVRTLDKLATDAIENVAADAAYDSNLSAEQEAKLYVKLCRAAQQDRNVENALVFGECGNRLLKGGSGSGNTLSALLSQGSGKSFNDLQTMARRFHADGVLSAVNYRALTAPDSPEKLAAARPAGSSDDYADLLLTYMMAREKGLTPQKAAAQMRDSADRTLNGGAGLAVLENQLLTVGKLALTGYDASSAQQDIDRYMESKWASVGPSAPDIKGVVPAKDPYEFIGNKVDEGIRRDLRTVLKPVKSIVEKFVEPAKAATPPPPAPETPNFDDVNRTTAEASQGGSSMPGWDQMQAPDYLLHPKLGPGGKSVWWWGLTGCTRKDLEFKWVKYGHSDFEFKIRQPCSDHNLRVIEARLDALEPNTDYEAEFNVWYWGEKGTVAYFGDGKTGSAEPPKSSRAYLTPSSGKTVWVHPYFRTDKSGKASLAFFARGRCAAQLRELFGARPVGAKKSVSGKKD